MKGTTIALDTIEGRKAAAMVIDGVLQDFLCDPPAGAPPMPGAILAARGARPAKGTGGSFVDLGGTRGFMRGGAAAPGRMLAVQVTGVAEPGKAIPVTADAVHKGRFAILTPGKPGLNAARGIQNAKERARLKDIGHKIWDSHDDGLILRSASDGVDHARLAADIRQLAAQYHAVAARLGNANPGEVLCPAPNAHDLAWRDWHTPDLWDRDPGSFDRHGVHDLLDQALHAIWPLPDGGSMIVEPTRALIAVDVNTGDDFSPAAGLKAMLAAIADLPRALRIKGLGGQIVIDPPRLPKTDRKRVEQAAERALRADPVETALVGWTPLGHLELQRQRDRWPPGDIFR
jgi:ribonuclease G